MSRQPDGRYPYRPLMGDPDAGPDAPATLDGGDYAKPQRRADKPRDYAQQMKREHARRRKIGLEPLK